MTDITQETSGMANAIVKISIIFIIGVLILCGITGNSLSGNVFRQYNLATITFTDNPVDGDTITLDSYIFEFDTGDGVSGDNIPVMIGSETVDTCAGLRAAVLAQTGYEVAAV